MYLLRRKKTKKNGLVVPKSNSFSIPISAESYHAYNSRYDDATPDIEDIDVGTMLSRPSDNDNWVSSLQQAYILSKNKQAHQTPIMVDGTSSSSNTEFRSNIPLPSNPFMPKITEKHYSKGSTSHHHFQKNSNHYYSPNSRADNFLSSLSSITAYLPKLPIALPSWNRLKSSSSLSKPALQATTPPPTVVVASLTPAESKVHPIIASAPARRSQMESILSKLEKLDEIKAALPPKGSYTPYGERTIIMLKYPGLPERHRVAQNDISLGSFGRDMYALGGIRPISITMDDWQTPSRKPIKLKDPDVGVIIAQNYILQPDVSLNSHYKYQPQGGDDSSTSDFDMVSQLAKALAERNRIINSFSAGKHGSSGPLKEPPFVLVHLESYTKKKNTTTPYGFDEEREISYSNGTIIYPSLDDPTTLASTKFEFEGLNDVENVFNRPLQIGQRGGGMKPIVPLGLVEIQNYLRLMYTMHHDIHDGGHVKMGELKGLAATVERQPLEGSRPMADWEVERNMEKYKENWMHTSTLGLRSISDYPPPPPKLPIPYPT